MEGAPTRTPDVKENASTLHFKEQHKDDSETSVDATISVKGTLRVSAEEEDVGGDPYNHTGRFERNNR